MPMKIIKVPIEVDPEDLILPDGTQLELEAELTRRRSAVLKQLDELQTQGWTLNPARFIGVDGKPYYLLTSDDDFAPKWP